MPKQPPNTNYADDIDKAVGARGDSGFYDQHRFVGNLFRLFIEGDFTLPVEAELYPEEIESPPSGEDNYKKYLSKMYGTDNPIIPPNMNSGPKF